MDLRISFCLQCIQQFFMLQISKLNTMTICCSSQFNTNLVEFKIIFGSGCCKTSLILLGINLKCLKYVRSTIGVSFGTFNWAQQSGDQFSSGRVEHRATHSLARLQVVALLVQVPHHLRFISRIISVPQHPALPRELGGNYQWYRLQQ